MQLLCHSKSLLRNKRFLYTNLLVLEISVSLDFSTKAKRTFHKMSYYSHITCNNNSFLTWHLVCLKAETHFSTLKPPVWYESSMVLVLSCMWTVYSSRSLPTTCSSVPIKGRPQIFSLTFCDDTGTETKQSSYARNLLPWTFKGSSRRVKLIIFHWPDLQPNS